MEAKEPSPPLAQAHAKPLLMVDIDGVLSLFGSPAIAGQRSLSTISSADGDAGEPPQGRFCSIDGIPHFLSYGAAEQLLGLRDSYELVWASGWEERANEHLPHLLGMPAQLPFLRFSREPERADAAKTHWKLDAIDSYAGERALAWIDDGFNAACHEWAQARSAPTLLVATEPQNGLTPREAQTLRHWAQALAPR